MYDELMADELEWMDDDEVLNQYVKILIGNRIRAKIAQAPEGETNAEI